MAQWQYQKGLLETGNGIYAYLQPDGGWWVLLFLLPAPADYHLGSVSAREYRPTF